MNKFRYSVVFSITALAISLVIPSILQAAPLQVPDNPAEIAAVAEMLRHPDLKQRVQAAFQLLEMGEYAKVAYPELLNLLVEDQAVDVAIAARSLFARPVLNGDMSRLVNGLKLDTRARVAAAWQLCHTRTKADSKTTLALIQALDQTDKHERNFIVVALTILAPRNAETLEALQSILKDPGSPDSPHTNYKYPRTSATIAMGMIGAKAHQSVPELLEILGNKREWDYQRAAACFSLGRIGYASDDILSELQLALKDENPIVRKHAKISIEAIGSTGMAQPKSRDSKNNNEVSFLIEQIQTHKGRINPNVIKGLRALGASAGPVTVKVKNKTRLAVHESIALAIGYLDSLDQPPKPVRIAREFETGAPSKEVRQYIMALGGIQQGIGPAMLEALTEAELDPRVISIRKLADLGPMAGIAVPALRKILVDQDWIVRREAMLTLQLIKQDPQTGRQNEQ